MYAAPNHRCYSVYILTNRRNGTLYIGVTNSLQRRMGEHKTKALEGFTKRYGLTRLVYYEDFRDVRNAIAREKALKGWLRARKIALIERENPEWNDLSADWYEPADSSHGTNLDSSLRSE